MPIQIKVKRLRLQARLPHYAHVGEFGDLAADLYAAEELVLARAGEVGSTQAVGTGIALEFPPTYGALVEDRSGLALRGVTTLAGVIDPGYRGEICVVLTNLGKEPVEVQVGDRVAQLRIVERVSAEFKEVEELNDAARDGLRGARGFGSTGA